MPKNYTKEGQKLPLFGIGPYLIAGITVVNLIVLILTSYIFKIGTLDGIWVWVFRLIGALLFAEGTVVWFIGAVKSDMDNSIADNKLKTDGIYAWVRNPMYSGIWFVIAGMSFMWHNIFSVPMLIIDWLILTIVIKKTEERWLMDLYGNEYAEYIKRVNRFIPWKRK